MKDDMLTRVPRDDNRMNSKMKSLLDDTLDSMDSNGSDVSDIAHKAPGNNSGSKSLMATDLMNFTQMLECMNFIIESMDNIANGEGDITEQPLDGESSTDQSGSYDENDLLEELNKIFTPVLVTQKFEQDISDQTNAELSEAAVLTEKNMISFDEPARMAQLISVCAMLLSRSKNTEKWQMFKKAAAIKKNMKLEIQKEEYDAAKDLAQKYLVMVSTSNNSAVARNAANDLLPQTQH